jgi:enoyl-CoA hydratase/carnithine racemase
MTNVVLTERDEGVGVLSLNRPERHNALNDELVRAFGLAMNELMADDQVRVVLLRGEGRSFSSGRDTGQLGRRVGNDTDLTFLRRHSMSRMTQLTLPKPIVAALKGYVIGGALETALACDMRIAATNVRMAFPEVKYGLVTDTGGSPLATLLAGPSRAKWMLMTGEYVDAERALHWGLVDEVVAPDELDATALALCKRLAQVDSQLLGLIKQLVDQTHEASIRAGLRSELLAQLALFSQRRPITPGDTDGAV